MTNKCFSLPAVLFCNCLQICVFSVLYEYIALTTANVLLKVRRHPRYCNIRQLYNCKLCKTKKQIALLQEKTETSNPIHSKYTQN